MFEIPSANSCRHQHHIIWGKLHMFETVHLFQETIIQKQFEDKIYY